MWSRSVVQLRVVSLRWHAQTMQRRCAASSPASSSTTHRGHNSFRAGTVDPTPYQVKPNFNIPLWQPPARFMKYRAVRWLSNNLLALATYQLALEVGFTVVFGSLLYAEKITAEGVCAALEKVHYPFMSWIDVSDCVYTEPVHVGPFSLNPQKLTALHTGHNLANGLLPVQVVLMLSTFAPVHRVYRSVRGLPAVAGAATTTTTSGAAPSATPTAAKTASTHRRASYARASSKTTSAAPPRQPF